VIYEIIIVAQSENIKIWNGETMAPHLRLPQQEKFFGIQMKFLFIEYLPRNSIKLISKIAAYNSTFASLLPTRWFFGNPCIRQI
jgi:hypothetical protein